MAILAPTMRGQDTYKASFSQEERDKWQLDNRQWRDLATPPQPRVKINILGNETRQEDTASCVWGSRCECTACLSVRPRQTGTEGPSTGD